MLYNYVCLNPQVFMYAIQLWNLGYVLWMSNCVGEERCLSCKCKSCSLQHWAFKGIIIINAEKLGESQYKKKIGLDIALLNYKPI